MYASVDTAIPFSLALLVFLVVERVTHVILCMFFPGAGRGGGYKDAASAQFVVSIFDLVTSLATSVLYTATSVVSAALGGLFWATVLIRSVPSFT